MKILVLDKKYGQKDNLETGVTLLRQNGHDVDHRRFDAPIDKDYDLIIAHPERGDISNLVKHLNNYKGAYKNRKSPKVLCCSGWFDRTAENTFPIDSKEYIKKDVDGTYYTCHSNQYDFPKIVEILFSEKEIKSIHPSA